MGELEQLQQAIAALEAQRSFLGEAVVEAALGPMRHKLAELQSSRQPEQLRKLATILFMDIAGHTALTHHLDPEEQMDIIDQALIQMAAPVAHLGGRVVRFQGDGFKAVFGLPEASENDPDNAIRAGLAIQVAAGEIAGRLERERGLKGFAVRVGIATGWVLSGGGTEGEDAVKGEPVNLAARLESSAQPGTVQIAHSTYLHVRGVFDMQPLAPIQAKGFEELVTVYRVLAEKARSFRVYRRGVDGVVTRMVGRDRQLNRLQELFTSVVNGGRQQFVTITGEPGLGKSRLLYEFQNWVDLHPARVHLYRGRARLETCRLPHGLLRDLFSAEFEINDSDSEAVAIEKLERGIHVVSGPEQDDWAPFIGHIIGFDFTRSPRLQGIREDAQQIRDLGFNRAVQFFKTVMSTMPVLVFLDDIHWADDGSLDFVEHLARETQDFPLMIVCLARHMLFERRRSWGEGQAHVRIDLAPLSEQDSQRLVGEILRNVPEIPPTIHKLIVSRAEGNPFYVEEVIRMLIDDGVILPLPERWEVRTDKFIAGKIPATLAGVLQARLDGLPVEERKVLDRASVAGRVFWDDLTAQMKESPAIEVASPGIDTTDALANLQGRELIYLKEHSSFASTTEYTFKHSVLRDVAYERLLKKLRRVYHLQVAMWLRDHGGERVGEFAGRIGEHYERGGELALAAEWYYRAGKQAQDTYAPEMAKDYFQKALSIWNDVESLADAKCQMQVEASHGLGQVLNWLGQYTEAAEVFAGMVKAAETVGDMLMQARAWHGIAEAQMHRGEARAAVSSAAREEDLARQVGADLELARALWMQAWGAFRLGEIENAFSLAGQVSELSRRLQDRSQMAQSLNLLGVLESVAGRFQEAARYFRQALEIFRLLGNRVRAMPLMNNLGVILEAAGDYPAALKRYQEALDTAREIGNRDGEMVYLSNLGGVKVRLGDYSAAQADLLQVIEMAGNGGVDALASTYSFLADAYLGQDEPAQALVSARQALSLAEEMESQEDLGLAWRVLGRVAASFAEPVRIETREGEAPRRCGAEECFAESQRIFKEIEREDELARTLREWARYKLDQGVETQGKRLWDEARSIFARLGAQAEVDRMMEEYAQQTYY